jgi:hypothetical protein
MKSLAMQVSIMNFIIKPIVIKQWRKIREHPNHINDTYVEKELHRMLNASSNVFYGRLRNKRIFRIQTQNKIVYAIGQPTIKGMVIIAIKSEYIYYSNRLYMRHEKSKHVCTG